MKKSHFTPPQTIAQDILDRLERVTCERPFDTRAGVWKARCPVSPSSDHSVFLIANADALDLFCGEHSTREICHALGFRLAHDLPRVGDVALIKPDPISSDES